MKNKFNKAGLYRVMREDLYLLLPYKKDRVIDIDVNKAIIEKLDWLKNSYCIPYSSDGEIRNIMDDLYNGGYNGICNGEIRVTGGEETIKLIDSALKNKARMFMSLIDYHQKVIKTDKDTFFLCFSLLMGSHNSGAKANACEDLSVFRVFLKLFFNNIRSRAFYRDHVTGYFWVLLQDYESGRVYAHVNFYVNKKNFNDFFAREINSSWYNILRKHDYNGEIKHFTIKEGFNNGNINKEKDRGKKSGKFKYKVCRRYCTDRTIRYSGELILDFNSENYYGEYAFTNNHDEISFGHYVGSLVRKACSLPGLRSFDTASTAMALRKALQKKAKHIMEK
ncbi:hypothetical protein Q4Q99_14660 [Morganella morganii]